MAKKNDPDVFAYLIVAPLFIGGFIAGILFFLHTLVVNKRFAKKYSIDSPEVIRVHENSFSVIKQAFGAIMSVGIFAAIGAFSLYLGILAIVKPNPPDSHPIFLLGLLIGPLFLFFAWCFSARFGIEFIGTLILPQKGIFVIPCDFYKNTFTENFLHGKLFTEMFKMEELPLGDIQKITREKGKFMYIHGKFGTRRLTWEDKQKRDECVSTLERACKKRLSSFDGGY